jgi:outer membrane lipopolysaccharide assembly protein LptE/RlpB
MRLLRFDRKKNIFFVLFIVLCVNNHSNGFKVRNEQDIDSILDILSENIDNGKNNQIDETKNSLTESPPSVIAKKKSTTLKVESNTDVKTEADSVNQETTQHSSQWTMFFILCILGSLKKIEEII